ncbi:unnamed protein product [Zymoseptoria tritici ST99CH_1E4]|uniref:Elongation factor 2 n=1 Tax=Zymoseptoria tritici ST99CH_1E4 TaxID=1276532 RepID=A0A2H1FYY3_ZYMTR|nr:unnamed protein product [Zymoseptoria tritici ST99CH_1E4]
MSGLQAQPLSGEGQFNWVFQVEILVIGVLALFFLFYFNRLFATLVSYAIRWYTWRNYKAYIDISSLQISLLGGRIFFKSIRYHAHNVTVYVYEGHITWRYWLRLVQEAEVFQGIDLASDRRSPSTATDTEDSPESGHEKPRKRARSIGNEEKASTKPKKELPCRISVKVAGVEAFIYNRSPLYDNIVEATFGKSTDNPSGSPHNGHASPPTSESGLGTDLSQKDQVEKTETQNTSASAMSPGKPELPFFLRIFPIKVECRRAAAAIGNENTTNVLVAKAEKSQGSVDAGHAGPLDAWKLLFNFTVEKVNVAMKPNRDFKAHQLDAAQHILHDKELAQKPSPSRPVVRTARKVRSRLSKFGAFFRRSSDSAASLRAASVQMGHGGLRSGNNFQGLASGAAQWHGLKRYLDDTDVNEHDEWQDVEYAKASQLAEIDRVTMRFYWDMAGLVRDQQIDPQSPLSSKYEDDINGSPPPEYGMDLGVHGGFVVYGPWADRQRVNLQSVFFPAPCVDATPAKPLLPGEFRVCTIFKIVVIVEEDVVLRIPSREESKDSRWKGRADKAARPTDNQSNEASKGGHWKKHRGKRRKGKQATAPVDARPYGWLDITVKKDSVVNYVMDMFPRSVGYRNTLDLDVKGLEMSSSVNHGLLWQSGPLALEADISQPLTWNSLRKWPFNIVVNNMELFILRDHLFLIIDLVNDWASGAPSEFFTFVPYNYQLDLTLKDFVMYLNVNDANIINDPADFERNNFLTIEGQLHAILGIPMENYRPKTNAITFDVVGHDMRMQMFSPPGSTLRAFVQQKTMVELPGLTLKGSYSSNQEAKIGNVDVLRMDIVGSGLSLQAYGFFVRQLVSLKENYFGDYMHFKTLEEFQGASDDLEEANRKTASFPKPSSISELDVILCIVAEDATVFVPTNIYSCEEYVRIDLPRADLDLRIASYYLDMSLQLSPLSFLSGTAASDDTDDAAENASGTQLFVAHVDLNGHRAFGLPPNEDAYVSQWDIDIGKVKGELSTTFVRDLALAGQAFAFSIGDAENALPVSSPAVALDASFVQVRTDYVRLWLHVGKDALLLHLDPITVETSDWASDSFSQRVNVIVPKLTLACVDGRSATRNRLRDKRRHLARTYAFFQTGMTIDVLGRKLHFDVETRKQQSHFRLHDQRTNRFPFLLRPEIDAPIKEEDDLPFEPPAMPYPPMPVPLKKSATGAHRPASLKSSISAVGGKQLRHMSSQNSLASSLRNGRLTTLSARPGVRNRTSERSTGGTSASFHSLRGSSRSSSSRSTRSRPPGPNHAEISRPGLSLSTIAFSSSYSEPCYPMETVEPDESNVPGFPALPRQDESESEAASIVDAIEDIKIDQDAEHQSIFIKIVPGIRAYLEPRVAITVSELVRKVLPRNPREVMDDFQIGLMGAVQSSSLSRNGHPLVLEVHCELQGAHMRIATVDHDQIEDQVDLILDSLETHVRIRNCLSEDKPAHCLALHTLLSKLDLTLKQCRDSSKAAPALHFGINDALVWFALADTDAVHLSLRETSLIVDGSQTTYITQLAMKLVPVAADVITRFERSSQQKLARLQLLAFLLTQHGEQISDPAFMARMVYTLRAFPDHFRNTDSWKIVSRLRYVMQSLPQSVFDELEESVKAKSIAAADDETIKALTSWTQWRNWDVPNANQTIASKTLTGSKEAKKSKSAEAKPLTVTVQSGILRVAVEHSGGTSDVVMEGMSLGAENTPPIRPEGLLLVEENRRTQTLLQVQTGTTALHFDWTLLTIAEEVLANVDKSRPQLSRLKTSESRTTSQALEDGLSRHDVSVVLSTDTGSITLQTPNLRHVSRADGLKLSLIGTSEAAEDDYGQCVSALLNFDTAVTELHGPTTRLWQTLITSPSLYIDYLQAAAGGHKPPSVTLAIAYEDLQVAVNEQIPGILHVIETVIVDEVAQVQRVIKIASPGAGPNSSEKKAMRPTSASSTRSQLPKLNLAMLSGNLHVEVSLLQALSYQLQGNAASFRMAPNLSKDKEFSIDFDSGRQSHAFVNSSGNERHTQGIVEVPPINGNIGLELGKDRTAISVASTIDTVEVDAGAIQGLIGVLNQPEVQSVISAIQSGVEDIRLHVAEMFPEKKPDLERSRLERHIAYDGRIAMLGVRVSATTPAGNGHSTAEVEFGIGPVHATASNRALASQTNSLIPEVRAHIQGIGASLHIKDRGLLKPCGNVSMDIGMQFSNKVDEEQLIKRELNVRSDGMEVNAYPDTASTIIDVINHLQDRIKHLDVSKEVDYLRRLRDKRKDTVLQRIKGKQGWTSDEELPFSPADLLSIETNVLLTDIQVCWLVDDSFAATSSSNVDDLIFSIESVQFTTKAGSQARLSIYDVLLQLAKKQQSRIQRSLNSALLPEVGFSVAYWKQDKDRSLAFKATGKPLDLRLESKFMLPLSAAQRSIETAIEHFKSGTATWKSMPTASGAPRRTMFDTKRMTSLLIEADFAGAQVYLQGSRQDKTLVSLAAAAARQQGAKHGRYGQFAADGAVMNTTLTAPGIAFKLEYNSHEIRPSISGEIMIDASSNKLLPNVVPLILEVTESVKTVMQSQSRKPSLAADKRLPTPESKAQKFFEDDSLANADPAKFFGKTKVDLGFRVSKQEFGLTCQPIARVDAKASLDDFYVTMNTIDSDEHGHFFAMSAVVTGLKTEVKHMYSREPTFSFDMDSVVLSAMNNKHLNGKPGVSAILNINPTRIVINGKQFQDLLLFREIWIPPEIRHAARQSSANPTASSPTPKTDDFFVQRYQNVAAAAAFPWDATVSIKKLAVDLDLGQSIGKSSFTIENLWASQQKSSNWEQNLCIGLDEMAINSTGRMSGFIELKKLGVRTSIKWPEAETETSVRTTPFIQASVGFQKLRAKAAFDYQAFAFADIESFDFLMYNVREQGASADRLVAVLDCEKAYVFCTSTSPAQAFGLYQAFDRLIQEKQTAYVQSLRDIEKHLRRESTAVPTRFGPQIPDSPVLAREKKSSISLHTDVVVTMGAVCFGVYPSTFFDSQMLKLEANNIQARFAVGLERGMITSGLGMTLGQLQVALSSARKLTAVPKALDVSVDEVIANALNAKGGIILRVPKVVASMQTWQTADTNSVDYIFKSLFDGKIDVGWNLSRINFIKGMWMSHSRAFASRTGKALPESAVKITAGTQSADESQGGGESDAQPEKITAEINLPQSRYEYRALEEPIIETPQLRDMGEATPPLEWIGLNRDRLPNVTHQIIIVSLLEVCKEVEEAYEKILGSS